jgi:hypothetical protein
MKARNLLIVGLTAISVCKVLAEEKEIDIPATARVARIDISNRAHKIELTPNKNCNNPSWCRDNKMFNLYSYSEPLTTDKWTDFSLEFTPMEDGDLLLVVQGQYWKLKDAASTYPVYVLFSALEVTGAELKNSNFSQLSNRDMPISWSCKGDVKVLKEGDGNKIRVAYRRALISQSIKVTKGQKVTISTKVKYAKQ